MKWFRVPAEPPILPVAPGDSVVSFRPAQGFLRYLKFLFWVTLTVFDGFLIVGWLAILTVFWPLGVFLFPLLVTFVIVPDIAAYVAIHLRYDTTWYVLTRRSLRVRRGIWIIHETTITFENVQNVVVQQGPVERYFGISNVIVHTAGGGRSVGSHGESAPAWLAGHIGKLEGVANAAELRDLILSRVRESRSAGLGDELAADPQRQQAASCWTPGQVAALREIRDAARALAG